MNNFFSIQKLVAALVGILWCAIKPTIPFLIVALLAELLDVFTAVRLNRRIKMKMPRAGADGKLKSCKLVTIMSDMGLVFSVIIISHLVEVYCLPQLSPMYLPNYVCAAWCAIEGLSCLENESSCSNKTWAKIAQKVVANKVARHIDMSPEELQEILDENKKSE